MPDQSSSHEPLVEVLLNERAGLGGSEAAAIADRLKRAGLNVSVRGLAPGEMSRAIRDAAPRAKLVAVSGGDGTMLSAAEILAGSSVALAPIPTGTLNHFAKRVGLSDPESAARAIIRGRTMQMPLGVLDDRLFLNTATFGLYADVVRQRERMRPWLSKWPAAAVAIAGRLLGMRRLRVILEVDGERLERFTPLVWVGLGWGSFPRVHRAPERRGQPDLEIVVLRPRGRFGIVGLAARFIRHLFRGNRPVTDPALEVIHARSLLIHSGGRIGVTLDGEVLRLEPPVFLGVVDDGLRVVVPAG